MALNGVTVPGSVKVHFEPVVLLRRNGVTAIITEGGIGNGYRLGFYRMSEDGQMWWPITPGSLPGFRVVQRAQDRTFDFSHMLWDIHLLHETDRRLETAVPYVVGVYYAGQIIDLQMVNFHMVQAATAGDLDDTLRAEVMAFTQAPPEKFRQGDLSSQRALLVRVLTHLQRASS